MRATTFRALSVLLFASVVVGRVLAQTTDGYHAIQVFPVVVDTASFAQRFHFRNPNGVALTITPRYFPASGTTAPAMTCPDFVVPALSSATFTSLRVLCPALAAGSQFGFLHTSGSDASISPYSAFSRVTNPQGNGFSVEAFPAHVFTSATTVVEGIRRAAASGGAPAFQTNCFVGNLNEVVPIGVAPSTVVHYSLYSSAGALIGGADLSLAPGQFVRLLDVFSIAPAGDYVDSRVKFEELGVEEPAILAFCTVQDNTSFGADFRIAKQERHHGVGGVGGSTIGSQDAIALRDFLVASDGLGRQQILPKGKYNVHVLYFRHPDYVACRLIKPDSSANLGMTEGLEMRMTDQAGAVLAGGDNVVSFGKIYLGEKTDRFGGFNARYYIRVEDNGHILRPDNAEYRLNCVSGSGSTLPDIVVFQEVGIAF